MKVVILAGGYGTRISEESDAKPKPMIEIGNMPILWHIMKSYSYFGYNEFIICAGYKQHMIKEWFADYFLYTSDVTFDYTDGSNKMTFHNKTTEPWKVTVVDTGLDTETGGRIKRIRKYIGDEAFLLTYGDGVADVDINKVVDYHIKNGKVGTITIYNYGQNKGIVEVGEQGIITDFREKADKDGNLINIGYMVFEPEIFDYIESDMTPLEGAPLDAMVRRGQLVGYVHNGYWQCMDTVREKKQIEKVWDGGNAPWKVW